MELYGWPFFKAYIFNNTIMSAIPGTLELSLLSHVAIERGNIYHYLPVMTSVLVNVFTHQAYCVFLECSAVHVTAFTALPPGVPLCTCPAAEASLGGSGASLCGGTVEHVQLSTASGLHLVTGLRMSVHGAALADLTLFLWYQNAPGQIVTIDEFTSEVRSIHTRFTEP